MRTNAATRATLGYDRPAAHFIELHDGKRLPPWLLAYRRRTPQVTVRINTRECLDIFVLSTQTRSKPLEKCAYLGPAQSPYDYTAIRGDAVHLKYILRQIEPDDCNLFHDLLL
jgi:hypothetical protein